MGIIDEFGKIAEYKNNFKISLFEFFPFGCHFSNKKTGFYLGNSFLGTWSLPLSYFLFGCPLLGESEAMS